MKRAENFAREHYNASSNASRATVPADQDKRGRCLRKINEKELGTPPSPLLPLEHLVEFCVISFGPFAFTFTVDWKRICRQDVPLQCRDAKISAPPQCAWICAWIYLCRVSIVGYKKKRPAPNTRHVRLYIRCSRRVQEFIGSDCLRSAVG